MENYICCPIMFIDDTNSRPISKPILVFKDPPYARPFQSHDDPRNPLSQPNHRSHEDHKDDQEILRQWLECVEWMDKEEALMESNLDLASNGEILTPFEDETYPSIEEALDENDSRVTNPSEILNTQIRDEDDINEHGKYSITISLKPCSYETSPNLIGLYLTTFEICNPLILSSYKNFKRVVVDAYVYHKYCRSHCD
jgi:hypothetical protein